MESAGRACEVDAVRAKISRRRFEFAPCKTDFEKKKTRLFCTSLGKS